MGQMGYAGQMGKEGRPHSSDVNKGNTYGAGKSSDPVFVLTGIPSTPRATTSYPPDVVEVLQKSFEELEQVTTQDKEPRRERTAI
ncbi:hypothetical protein CTI12_AA526670 [Artemisia annua]|uniref:Uncharacterized protein n=1 Tax=Artemisia annua TaxID=35608 RepID=A0A2U1L5Y4_ARTAN|nr:hypothetical protein CTI12_AA526670 [Artemisia annua]